MGYCNRHYCQLSCCSNSARNWHPNGLIPPLAAAISAILIAESLAPSVAFAGGILGTLIGGDLLHLKEIERMSAGVLSIGGAGVFDGIAMCGLFALLLT